MWQRALFICGVVLGAMLAWPDLVLAHHAPHHDRCSCLPPDPVSVAFAQAEAVFAGAVTEIVDPSQSSLLLGLARLRPSLYTLAFSDLRILLAVNESWKGITTRTISIRTPSASGECGYPFAVGQDYLVYARRGETDLETTFCMRTNHLDSATVDLHYLQPRPRLKLWPSLPLPWICLTAVIGVGLACGAAKWWRRRP